MQENVSYFAQSAERRSYIGAYSSPSAIVVCWARYCEGGGKVVLVEEVVRIVGGKEVAMVVGSNGLAFRKARTLNSDGADLLLVHCTERLLLLFHSLTYYAFIFRRLAACQ